MALKINTKEFKKFVLANFKNKTDCAKRLEVSRTHLEKMLNGETKIGTVLEKRIKNFIADDVLFNQLVFPEAIRIGDMEYREIIVEREDGSLIASITSRDIICEKGIIIEYIPDDSI